MQVFPAPSPSRRNTDRTAPRSVVVVTLLTAVLALTAAAFATPANAAACKPGTIAWKVNGKSICLKTAKLPSNPSRPAAQKSLTTWMKTISKPALPIRGARRTLKLPPKLRRAVPKATAMATKLIAQAQTVEFKSTRRSSKLNKLVGIASSSPVVERATLPSRTQTLPNGVEVKAWGEMKAHEDGSVTADAHVDLETDGYTLRYKPHLEDVREVTIPDVGCPTASGRLKTEHSSTDGGTLMLLKGRTVIGARTLRTTRSFSAEGQVGRDAKLADVSASSSLVIEIYERGLQYKIALTGNATATREGQPAISGTPSARVRLRSASLTAAQERVAEAEMARKEANDPSTGEALARGADLGRWRMLQDEYKWYQLPNYCARASFDPEFPKLNEGQSLSVSGVVSALSGGEAAGNFEAATVNRGSFTPTKSEFDPGAPAKFTAVGGQPDSEKITVDASMIVTSTAGRAQATWSAEADDLKVPKSFGGWIEAETIGNGLRYKFDAMFDFNLTYTNTGPNGFATAWYELDHIDAMKESVNAIGTGCRLEAKSSSGGVVNSGDVELRRQSYNSGWTYAIQIDFSIPNQQFVMTDCPPDAQLPEFTADIVNYLYTAPNGSPFRPIWSGSTENDMRLIDEGQTDVTGPGQLPTTAEWGLIGSF